MKKVLIISGFGINCENETKNAFDSIKAESKIIHINLILDKPSILDDFDIIVFPGGFSYGDNLGSGFALASLIKLSIKEKLNELIEKNKIILGICNGCQILVKLGLFNIKDEKITIINNKNNIGYKCMWRECDTQNTWHFEDIRSIKIPVAHGEGCFIDLNKNNKTNESLNRLNNNGLVNENCKIILKYSNNQNHNGSDYAIAGVSNKKGNVIAIMPHPERAICFDENKKNKLKKQNNYSNYINDEISLYQKFFYNLLKFSSFAN
jgi:phosphoribosylformylglycinamidine (FGAM) synthase-like amidotransferase family enzyme